VAVKAKKAVRHRSAVTGRYVTETRANKYPRTTIRETDKARRKRA
jgi:hypothetical protein